MSDQSQGTTNPQTESEHGSHPDTNPVGVEGQPYRLQKHLGTSERHLSIVVDVEDASRLIECSQIHRQSQFQYIVRRFLSQILYGCRSASCTTPTCLSCKQRLISRPHRAPTQLTARALAHFLASQHDPYAALCPHELKISPTSLAIDGAPGVTFGQAEDGNDLFCNVYPTFKHRSGSAGVFHHFREHTGKHTDVAPAASDKDGLDDIKLLSRSISQLHQKKKDAKSLGQNLYDTATLIFSYSKEIPSPLSVFNSLRSAGVQHVTTTDVNDILGSDRVPSKQQNAGSLNTAWTPSSTPPPDSHSPRSLTNGTSRPSTTTRQHSQQDPGCVVNPEFLCNSQSPHEISQPLLDSTLNVQLSSKNDEPDLDSVQEVSASLSPVLSQKTLTFSLHDKSQTNEISLQPHVSTKGEQVMLPKNSGNQPLLPIVSYLDCDIMDQLKEKVYYHRRPPSLDFAYTVDYDPNRTFRLSKSFVNRSLFQTLSDPETLLKSFHEPNNDAYKDSPLAHLNSTRLTHTFRDWNRRNGALIFDSLWIVTEALFVPPPELDAQAQKSPCLKASRKTAEAANGHSSQNLHGNAKIGRYLSDAEAGHIVVICIHALTSLVSIAWPHTWVQLRKLRSWGVVLPDASAKTDDADCFVDPWLDIIDELEYEPAVRLADRLVRGIGARTCFSRILHTLNRHDNKTNPGVLSIVVDHLAVVERAALVNKRRLSGNKKHDEDPGWTVTATFMEWLKTIIVKRWDGQANVNRWGSAGAAMGILAELYERRCRLDLRTDMFHMPYLHERIDHAKEPLNFLSHYSQPNTFHIFSYPFLFLPHYLVGYFRTINFTTMYKQYEQTTHMVHLKRELENNSFIRPPFTKHISDNLRLSLTEYIILDVSREHPLEDTLNQLWGHEKRMLQKPLKVKMGMDEGELGLDHGGITVEFFAVVLRQAFNSDNGMFTLDPQTRMTWFQPCSLEPDWKFEMIGLIFSLAVYNGITLPVTFPLAFYRALLGAAWEKTTDGIRDGWPGLAKSFDELLAWSDGDVAEVFLRGYAFSYEAFGEKLEVDMERAKESGGWGRELAASSQYEEPSTVTNANRNAFVQDYITWLTYISVAPQLEAFKKGFLACLHPRSLNLFEAPSLKALVEGSQDIDLAALKCAARYEDGYDAKHTTIINFWCVVDSYSMNDRKRLLQFVTASDRVPVTGFESVSFYIVRAGDDTERLPTSSTCFGKLYMPEYESKEKMKRKLDLAIQNSTGFGVI